MLKLVCRDSLSLTYVVKGEWRGDGGEYRSCLLTLKLASQPQAPAAVKVTTLYESHHHELAVINRMFKYSITGLLSVDGNDITALTVQRRVIKT